MSKKSTFKWVALVAALAALQGCGGGGGGGDFPIALAPAANTEPQPQSESKPPETSTPNTTTDRHAPVAGSEPAASVSEPQAGSTADVGSDWEGIYESTYGYTFITSNGRLARKDLIDWTWGSISVEGNNWSFNTDTRMMFADSKTVTGSGTFRSKSSMNGTYSKDGGNSTAWGPLKYSQSNALAITPESLEGKWSVSNIFNHDMSLEFGSQGVFAGTTAGSQFGVCNLSGSVEQLEPGTTKNMFRMTMTAINAATGSEKACVLDTSLPYEGFAAVVLAPAGSYPENGYFRTFAFHGLTRNFHLLTNYLRKVQ